MKLTVIFRDDGPMINCGDSPSYRSVQVDLNRAQEILLAPRCTYTVGGTDYFEAISKCFLEAGSSSPTESQR